MPLGPFDPIPPREKVRRSHVNDLRAALTGVQDAYDVAVADGFTGTRAEWLQSLVGPPGPPGAPPIDEVATTADLDAIVNPAIDDVYTVAATGHAHRWSGTAWIDIGQWRGDPGELVKSVADTYYAAKAATEAALAGAPGQEMRWDVDADAPRFQNIPDYFVNDHKATGESWGTDDTAIIERTYQAAVAGGRGGRIVARTRERRDYTITRRTASQKEGGIHIRHPNIHLDLDGARLILGQNCDFVVAESQITPGSLPSDLGAEITASVVRGATTLTVNSTALFTAGQWAFVELGTNLYDGPTYGEPVYWEYVTIVSVDSATQLTIDRPIAYDFDYAAETGAGYPATNRQIRPFATLLRGTRVENLELVNDNPASIPANGGVRYRWVQNGYVGGLTGANTGPGLVIAQYCDNLVIDRPILTESQKYPTAGGRAFTFSECRGVTVNDARVENFAMSFMLTEAANKNIVVNRPVILNTYPGRATSQPLFTIAGRSSVTINDPYVSGNDTVWASKSVAYATNQEQVVITNPVVDGPAAYPRFTDLRDVRGRMRINNTLYGEPVEVRKSIPLRANMASVTDDILLGYGLLRRLRIYVTDKTGITLLRIQNATSDADTTANVTSTLVNGQWVEIENAVTLFGTSNLLNRTTKPAKIIRINTDATVVAGSRMEIVAEIIPDPSTAWATSPGLFALGRTYTASNVTEDRSYNADATTLDEVADVLGTLIADLRQRGIVR